jgi:hypothetical protein
MVLRRRIYVPIALIITVMAFVGFWRTYYGNLLTGTSEFILLIHIHAAIYILWLFLLIAQAAFAATGYISFHIKLGPWIMVIGILVIIMGLAITFDRFGAEISNGNLAVGQRKLFGPLRDMVFFAPFLWAGWHWRNSPDVHKRLMIVATNILLVAAVGRMNLLGRPVPEWKFMLLWPLPVYICMAYDWLTKRIIHPVYIIGFFAMLTMRLILPLRNTDIWLEFSNWLASLY